MQSDEIDFSRYVVWPKYKYDKKFMVHREIDPPSDKLFIALGYDDDHKTARKHYRLYYNDELENIKEIFPEVSPFEKYTIKRGQTRGLKKGGLFSSVFKKRDEDESGSTTNEKDVGFFKAIVEVETMDEQAR